MRHASCSPLVGFPAVHSFHMFCHVYNLALCSALKALFVAISRINKFLNVWDPVHLLIQHESPAPQNPNATFLTDL